MLTDKDLWDNLRNGQHHALEQIYRSEFDYLYDYGRRLTPAQALVEDCIQELFVEIWQKRSTLSSTTAIRPYLIVSLRRKLYKHIKSGKKNTDVELKDEHFEAELAIDELIIQQEGQSERSQQLKVALQELSARQKEILYLKYYANLDYEEISEIMSLNYQSARNLVSRAISKLSKQLSLWLILVFLLLK